MKNRIRKKLLFDLRLLPVVIILLWLGFWKFGPLPEWHEYDSSMSLLGGACVGWGGCGLLYLVFSWVFYDFFYK